MSELFESLSRVDVLTSLVTFVLVAIYTIRDWVKERAEKRRQQKKTGWVLRVVQGEIVLFTEHLSVSEADQLVTDEMQVSKTGDARRLGQSGVTAFGFVGMPTYDIATVDSEAKTYTIHVDRDPTWKPKAAPTPKS